MLIRPATDVAVFTCDTAVAAPAAAAEAAITGAAVADPRSPASGGAFSEAALDALELCYRDNGFVVLRGVCPPELITQMQAECEVAQRQVVDGELDERYGSTVFLDEAAKAERFANYVEFINELSPAVRSAIAHPTVVAVLRRLLGEQAWLRDDQQFGVVYQDARPGKESGYTRIGWHSDWQSGPSQQHWPSTAFTFHLDPTSPANGFLRVVPGSHNWATPAPYRNINNVEVPATARATGGYTETPPPFEMPLAFGPIAGEVPIYCELGDIILHDCYLWHSAARATDDVTTRRHVRGAYHAGERESALPNEFIKNAAR